MLTRQFPLSTADGVTATVPSNFKNARRPDRACRSGTNLAVDLLSARPFQTADPVNDSLAAAAEGGAA
jgi:hypothetical protein